MKCRVLIEKGERTGNLIVRQVKKVSFISLHDEDDDEYDDDDDDDDEAEDDSDDGSKTIKQLVDFVWSDILFADQEGCWFARARAWDNQQTSDSDETIYDEISCARLKELLSEKLGVVPAQIKFDPDPEHRL